MTARPISHLVAEGRSLLAEATLGVWVVTKPSGTWPADYWALGTLADGLTERWASSGPNDGPDAAAIGWAMTNAPHLLDALDRVHALLRRWDAAEQYDDILGEVSRAHTTELREALEGDQS
ncbi:hypothetical protein [Nocardia sp. NPDC060249]|uniref:hypothetical protein n=1 Tax=Nocardia sp. NPDC060249 TaxID=3347082 RepID=UPI00364D5D38